MNAVKQRLVILPGMTLLEKIVERLRYARQQQYAYTLICVTELEELAEALKRG
jgi:hypothetical protein